MAGRQNRPGRRGEAGRIGGEPAFLKKRYLVLGGRLFPGGFRGNTKTSASRPTPVAGPTRGGGTTRKKKKPRVLGPGPENR